MAADPKTAFSREMTEDEKDYAESVHSLPLYFRLKTALLLQAQSELLLSLGDLLDDEDDDDLCDAASLITKKMFVEHFQKAIHPLLSALIFDTILEDHIDAAKAKGKGKKSKGVDDAKVEEIASTVSFVDVTRYSNPRRRARHVRKATVKDAAWIATKLDETSFGEIDTHESGTISSEAFLTFFEDFGLTKKQILLIFMSIDENDDGSISVLEYRKWISKTSSNPSTFQKILSAVIVD